MVNVQARDGTAAARPEASRAVWRRALANFALILAGVILLFRDAALSMASIWLSSSVYHHGLIVAPVTLWLICRRKDWRLATPQRDLLGAVIVAVAAFIWLAGRAASVALFGHVAIALSIIGAVIAVFGRALACRWAFALGFLFFMVPFGAEATPVLQHWAAVAVAAALNFSGVETARDGVMLTTSVGRFEMAEACAGLRFLLAAAMIASVVASLAFSGWKKRFAFIGAALAAAILANWVRAYLVVLAATLSDRRVGVGPEHVALGWVFYSALILGLIALARRFAEGPAAPRMAAPAVASHPGQPATLVALASCALIAAYDFSVVSAGGNAKAPIVLPVLQSQGFSAIGDNGAWAAFTPQADQRSANRYRSAAGDIAVSLSYVADDRAGAEIASHDSRAADGVAWRRLAVRMQAVPLRGDIVRVRIETLENDFGQKLDVATLYWLGEQYYASPSRLKAGVAASKLIGRRQPGGAFYIAADAGSPDLIPKFLAGAESVAAWRARTGVGP